jgi:hypothetical protein
VEAQTTSRPVIAGLAGLTVLLLAASVFVRGIRGAAPERPEDREPEAGAIAEPVQLLGRGARVRLGDLEPHIAASRRGAWITSARATFALQGCPALQEWLTGADGQAAERLANDLRRGSREEALASLALLFQVARATEWAPGVLGSNNAERLGALFQDWLRRWAEPAADDPLLAEPAIAAALAYARVMRLAYRAPAIGRAEAPYERARSFLFDLTGANEPRLTAFGESLSSRFPGAFDDFRREADLLEGFDREARVLFPGLTGECE